jgi:chromosome partitioning protein
MKVWTVTNQKGGVGKTTSAVSLAGLLSSMGFNTLVVDLDPHASLTTYFRYDPDELETSVYTLFQSVVQGTGSNPEPLIRDTKFEGLKLLPSVTALATLDRQASNIDGMGLILLTALKKLEDQFDYVIIDTPPLLGVLMVNALAACEHLIIPVQTEFLALKGLERMLRTLEMILKARKKPLEYTVVPTMFDRRTKSSVDSLRVLRDRYGKYVWQSMIPVDTKFRDASRVGDPISFYDPNTKGVRAYDALLTYLREME